MRADGVYEIYADAAMATAMATGARTTRAPKTRAWLSLSGKRFSASSRRRPVDESKSENRFSRIVRRSRRRRAKSSSFDRYNEV